MPYKSLARTRTQLSAIFLLLLAGCRPASTALRILETPSPSLATDASTPPPAVSPTPAGAPLPSASPTLTREWRQTGDDLPSLSGFDLAVRDFMQQHDISQGALAVTYQGRLALAHAYTWAPAGSDLTQPGSLFRIASLSKPLTAVAVLKLVQDGRLDLDTKVVDLLDCTSLAGQSSDPRLADITVAHLLSHRGGWLYEPMFNDIHISQQLGLPLPISQADIITYMSGVPLTFAPGTRFIYSNYGYLLIGRIIEAASGQPYQDYLQQTVLQPLGIAQMHLGHSLLPQRLPGEVTYRSDFTGPTVLDASGAAVPLPYGSFNLENMDSHGGWVASVVDLARFEASFDRSAGHPVLSSASIDRLFAPPPGETGLRYYGLGWFVDRPESAPPGSVPLDAWHSGRLPGTLTVMVHRFDGAGWVAFFNQCDSAQEPGGESYWDIFDSLHQAADGMDTWPAHDLFD